MASSKDSGTSAYDRFVDFRQVLFGLGLELRLTPLAAEANLASVVIEHDGIAHAAELRPAHDADVEGVDRAVNDVGGWRGLSGLDGLRGLSFG